MSVPISVVVPTYQRRDSLARLLDALCRQTIGNQDFEVVVSVDGSTDGTLEMLSARVCRCPLVVVQQSNTGRAAARNRAIEKSSGAIVAFVDDDMEPVEGFLSAHLSAHARVATDNLVVLGAAPMRAMQGASPLTRHLAGAFDAHLRQFLTRDYQWRAKDFYSGNFSVGRTLLEWVGGFDETFSGYGHEDIELAVRLQNAGAQFVYDEEAAAWQANDKSFRQLMSDRRTEGRTAVELAMKHPQMFEQLRLAWFDQAPLLNRVVRRTMLASLRGGGFLERLIITMEALVARLNPPAAEHVYGQLLGLFFWEGARDALVAHRDRLSGFPDLQLLARRLHS